MTLTAVSDKPSAPEGPLKVSDVTAKGCKLNWKPPEDDGGVPIQKYVVEKMDEATGTCRSEFGPPLTDIELYTQSGYRLLLVYVQRIGFHHGGIKLRGHILKCVKMYRLP